MNRCPPPDLDELPDGCWASLAAGAGTPGHAFHTAVIATVENGLPAARTVVLRAVETPSRTLWFHTDRRSAKVRALEANPRIAWVFWDPEAKVQLRANGQASLSATAAEIENQWAPLHEGSRGLYAGIETFLPVSCTVDAMDWLRLDRSGHLRARLDWHTDHWQSDWIDP